MYVCMYVCMCVCIVYVRMYVCMYSVCVCVCVCVCMYVHMYGLSTQSRDCHTFQRVNCRFSSFAGYIVYLEIY